jgi:acyl-CoA synthetase (AMP-forming)/AMP-acid ligase II
VLVEHEDVADVAVLGVPDRAWGEQVAAFIRPAAGRTPDPERLFAYCRDRLAPHKTPRYWTLLDAFPLTPSGKVQKYVLRERFVAASRPQTTVDGPDITTR